MDEINLISKDLKVLYKILETEDDILIFHKSFEIIKLISIDYINKKTGEINDNDSNFIKIYNNIFKFLSDNRIKNFEIFFKDLVLVSLFLKEEIVKNIKFTGYIKSRIRNISLTIIKIVEFLKNIKGADETTFLSIDNFEISMIEEGSLKNDLAEIIINYYYSILFSYYKITNQNIYNNCSDILDLADKISNFDIKSQFENLKDNTENNLFKMNNSEIIEMRMNLEHYLIDDINSFIIMAYNIKHLINQIKEINENYVVLNKRTIEKVSKEKEAIFHENIFMYLSKGLNSDSILISEKYTGGERYDIYLYHPKRELSTIIELKANDCSKINDNIKQVENYLLNSSKKAILFNKKPDFGLLVSYNIGNKTIDEIFKKANEGYEIISEGNIGYIYLKDIGKPIIIFIMNA